MNLKYSDIKNFNTIADKDELKVLKAIKEVSKYSLIGKPMQINYKDLCECVGWKSCFMNSQKIGYIIRKKFQLNVKHVHNGTSLLLNDCQNLKKLKFLYNLNGI